MDEKDIERANRRLPRTALLEEVLAHLPRTSPERQAVQSLLAQAIERDAAVNRVTEEMLASVFGDGTISSWLRRDRAEPEALTDELREECDRIAQRLLESGVVSIEARKQPGPDDATDEPPADEGTEAETPETLDRLKSESRPGDGQQQRRPDQRSHELGAGGDTSRGGDSPPDDPGADPGSSEP